MLLKSFLTRRRFLMTSAIAGIGLATFPARAASLTGSPPDVDIGTVSDGQVKFPPWSPKSEPPDSEPPNPLSPDKRCGFAIVGLGKLSLEQILPAFGESKNAKLVALVSGTPDKLKAVATQCGVDQQNCYSYDTFDSIKDNPAIDAVYIVLPNAMHCEFVIRSAKAGKHVLCEKPMATSSDEARQMIKACQDANRKLMIAYRMQYEPHARAAMKAIRSNLIGEVQAIDTVNVQALSDPKQWRLNKALSGGGSLPDIGLYCLNTSRALLGEEPVEIMATTSSPKDDPRFVSVEDKVSFMMRFPSGVIVNSLACYSAHQRRNYAIMGETGWINVDNAYAYEGQKMVFARRDGEAETFSEQQLPRHNQFALELDHMATCIHEDRVPRTPGEEGLQDQVLMEAIYRSAETRQPVQLDPVSKRDITRGPALAEPQ